MKNLILRNGLISGLIITGLLGISLWITGGKFSENAIRYGEWYGYASMILALSVIYFAIRSYRDEHLGGAIPFSRAFIIGILITVVASLVYVVGWMILSETLASDFMEQYMAFTLKKMEEEGASPERLEKMREDMVYYIELYKKPLFKAAITFMEIFPVGLVITLVSALILRRK